MSLFDDDPDAWYELLISLPPIDLAECARQQKEAKQRLLEKRDLGHFSRYAQLKKEGDKCIALAENEKDEEWQRELISTGESLKSMAYNEFGMWMKTAAPPPLSQRRSS